MRHRKTTLENNNNTFLNGPPQWPLGPTNHKIYWLGRCTIQKFDLTSKGLVYLTCLQKYWRADKYFGRQLYYTTIGLYLRRSGILKLFANISARLYITCFSESKLGFINMRQSTTIQKSLANSRYKSNSPVKVITTPWIDIFDLLTILDLYTFSCISNFYPTLIPD